MSLSREDLTVHKVARLKLPPSRLYVSENRPSVSRTSTDIMAEQKTPIVSSKVANPLPDVCPHAIKAGGLVFVSGSIGLDVNGKMVEGGIQEHTVSDLPSIYHTTSMLTECYQHQIISNLKHVLEEAGSGLDKIVKINIFITDMANYSSMNEVYTQYFKKPNLPGRTWVHEFAHITFPLTSCRIVVLQSSNFHLEQTLKLNAPLWHDRSYTVEDHIQNRDARPCTIRVYSTAHPLE